jgi:hypothetical protein
MPYLSIDHEDLHEAIAKEEWRKLRDRYGPTNQRIYRLTWEHKKAIHEAEFGKKIQRFPEEAAVR